MGEGGEGYWRPQKLTLLNNTIRVLAPLRGFPSVFLSQILAFMIGLMMIGESPNKVLTKGRGPERALMIGHAMLRGGGVQGSQILMERTSVMIDTCEV